MSDSEQARPPSNPATDPLQDKDQPEGAGHQTNPPIVGVGASAGGLDALKRFLGAVAPDSGMAFVLVLHRGSSHEGLLVELLSKHIAMEVTQVEEGIPIEADRVYVIPPNTYMTLQNDGHQRLHLERSPPSHGLRMPIDYFLRSLAEVCREHAIGIVLSGTGTDGTLGLQAIKGAGGMTMAQEPQTAQYDNMPRSAIASGVVDAIRPPEALPGLLLQYVHRLFSRLSWHAFDEGQPPASTEEVPSSFQAILDLLRTRTQHEFRSYKQGMLLRRIARRMGLHQIDGMDQYLEFLQTHPQEVTQLFKDFQIGVTGFFREAEAFDTLNKRVLAPLVREHGESESPIRVWVPGCASGEEPYSIAMLLSEQFQALNRPSNYQVFATDINEEALQLARAGVYPENIAADVPPKCLHQFFAKEDESYHISASIRESVIFAVQNLLSDPPFSKLDLISCRNLLIYLNTEVQEKLITLFHFALNPGGYLFLSKSETIGQRDDLFELVSKKWRIYQRIGTTRYNEVDFPFNAGGKGLLDESKVPTVQRPLTDPSRLGELTQLLLLQDYAPASVLINRRYEILYVYGPTDPYLKQPSGVPTADLMAHVREELETKLHIALHKAIQGDQQVVTHNAQVLWGGRYQPVKITVRPVNSPQAAKGLLLVSFEEAPERLREIGDGGSGRPDEGIVRQLEQELELTKSELQSTIEEQETSNEELKAAHEEVMSMNEELQSTNEELETSKEELQSLNEELTTVNSQLQEKVTELASANSDLTNLLSSTKIPTLFLDSQFRIKRYTPALKTLFNLLPTDVGRPLRDLTSHLQEDHLLEEAAAVLETLNTRETEVCTDEGRWYIQRILPYRTQDNQIDGVVVAFLEITERKQIEEELHQAKEAADQANKHKTGFLTGVSHDLRQPLTTLRILNDLLAQRLTDAPADLELIERQGQSLKTMADLLDLVLEIGKLESGEVTPKRKAFPVGDLLERLRTRFGVQAREKGLDLRVVPFSATVHSDPALLERILHNLLANAIQYTDAGGVLLGCRRCGEVLRIEVWDTGPGIPEGQQEEIFEEFHRLEGPAQNPGAGVGLGLAITRRLADLLSHPLSLRSRPGKGSVFAVEVPMVKGDEAVASPVPTIDHTGLGERGRLMGRRVLLIEDDPGVLEALGFLFEQAGLRAITASGGEEAVERLQSGDHRIDLIITDHLLSGQEKGTAVVQRLQEVLGTTIPTIFLTGDTSLVEVQGTGQSNEAVLYKPVDSEELITCMQQLLE